MKKVIIVIVLLILVVAGYFIYLELVDDGEKPKAEIISRDEGLFGGESFSYILPWLVGYEG